MRSATRNDTVFEWEGKWYAVPFFRKMRKEFIQLPNGTVLKHSSGGYPDGYQIIVLVDCPDSWAIGLKKVEPPSNENDIVHAEEIYEQVIWSDPEDGP